MKLQFRIKDYIRDVWRYMLAKVGGKRFLPSYSDIIAGNMGFCEKMVRKFDLSRLDEFNVNSMRITLAIMNASDRVIKTLIEKKAFVGFRDYDFERMVCVALKSSHIRPMRKIVEMLFNEDPSGYFYRNAKMFTKEMVESAASSTSRWALDFIADNSFRSLEKWRNVCSEPLLQHVRECNNGMLRVMLEYNFDVHVGGDVAFGIAARKCDPAIMHTLLVCGCSIAGDDYNGIRKAIISASHEVLWDILNRCDPKEYERMDPEIKRRLLERAAMGTQDDCEIEWISKEIQSLAV